MFNSILTSPMTLSGFLLCLVSALLFGILTALVFSFKNRISSSFALTLAILPAAMCMVVMMINGNLGIAVAVAGSFTLVRFRSIAGTGREISAVFVVMALGVILGMGYLGIAALFFACIALPVLLLTALCFGEHPNEKCLRVTIPEDYDYTTLLSDVFAEHKVKAEIERIKTVNLGSLIEVTYRIILPGETMSKELLDAIRTKNGNLCVMLTSPDGDRDSL